MNTSFSNSRIIAWTVWMIASIFYAYQYILRVMPNIMLDDIMTQFHIGAAAFGQFSGIYYIGYSLMHLPLGILLDRFGPRKIMTLSILFSSAGLLPLILAENWVYPVLGRLCMGMGSSAAILGLFKIIRMTFNEEKFPRMLGFSVTIGLVGAIYGGAPVSYMKEVFGYQFVIQFFALMGIGLAAMTYFLVPRVESQVSRPLLKEVKEVFFNRQVMSLCLFSGLMVGPLEGFADVWGTAFLREVYHFEGSLSSSLPSMIFIGMCFGAPLLSLVADKVGNYLLVIMAAGSIMAAIFFSLLTGLLNVMLMGGLFILIGICSAYQILAIYKASTYVREQVVGLATAICNMMIMIFGYAFHTIIGTIINGMGGPSSSLALIYGTLVIPVALFLGTCGFTFLWVNEKKQRLANRSTLGQL